MNITRKISIISFSLLFFLGTTITVSASDVSYRKQVVGFGDSKIVFDDSTRPLGQYIKDIFAYGVGVSAVIATVVLMIGGFQWVTAGGNTSKIEEAKSWIFGSISGLALALSAYTILSLISPNLVNFKVKDIEVIKPKKIISLPERKLCTDALGTGWITVDGNYCTGSIAGTEYSECKITKITDTRNDCCCKKKEEVTPTTFHKECTKQAGLVSGDPTTYHCQMVSGDGPNTCSVDSQCNAVNSK